VTLGIQPTEPATGFGYIQRGEQVQTIHGQPVYRVRRFVEKPQAATAQQYVQSGDYYWNSGIFIWKVSTILQEIRTLLPELHAQLMQIDAALGGPAADRTLKQTWAQIQPVTIDVGIMERSAQVRMLPLDVGWDDVGSWAALADILPHTADGNVVVRADHVGIDTTGSLIYGRGKMIATLGLRDMVVVETEDVILVCPRERAQDVRLLVDLLKTQGKTQYL
ncbi:MAG: mannose-1-phosphate guanyltransferase, partial [Chloroflexi bacterium]|nr:mannose-1-phosphate guanyltransferase [Chloroflexota bacterium]